MLRSQGRRRCRRRRRLERKRPCRWCGVRAPVVRVRRGVWRRVRHHDLCTRCYLSAEDRLRAWALSQEQCMDYEVMLTVRTDAPAEVVERQLVTAAHVVGRVVNARVHGRPVDLGRYATLSGATAAAQQPPQGQTAEVGEQP